MVILLNVPHFLILSIQFKYSIQLAHMPMTFFFPSTCVVDIFVLLPPLIHHICVSVLLRIDWYNAYQLLYVFENGESTLQGSCFVH